MPIINREFDVSERKSCLQQQFAAMATGVTYVVSLVPNNALLTGVFASAVGISNTPTMSFSIYRFNTGTTAVPVNGSTTSGFTAITIGATLTVPAYGTSGFAFYGSTVNGLTTSNVIGTTIFVGDLLVAYTLGTNASLTTAVAGGVVQATDDILKWPA